MRHPRRNLMKGLLAFGAGALSTVLGKSKVHAQAAKPTGNSTLADAFSSMPFDGIELNGSRPQSANLFAVSHVRLVFKEQKGEARSTGVEVAAPSGTTGAVIQLSQWQLSCDGGDRRIASLGIVPFVEKRGQNKYYVGCHGLLNPQGEDAPWSGWASVMVFFFAG